MRPSTVSSLNKKVYGRIEKWLNAPIEGEFAYVFLDGIWLKRSWTGEFKNVSMLVAVGVDQFGYRQVLGVKEGAKEDKESWAQFVRHLKSRGLKGVQLCISDKCLGLIESLADFYPDAKWQRCAVHLYRNVFTAVPKARVKVVAAMLKAIHAQEDREAAEEKVDAVIKKLRKMKLSRAATIVEEGALETLSYKGREWLILEKDAVDEIIFRTDSPRDLLTLELMARGGMRIGEVLKLRMRDVDDCKLFLVRPKSGRQNEVVYTPKKVAARLREYIRSKEIAPEEMISRNRPQCCSRRLWPMYNSRRFTRSWMAMAVWDAC